MRQTRGQKHFTISEITADWHEIMILQHTMQPYIARVSEQLDPWFAASRHTTTPISRTRTSPHSPSATSYFPSHRGWVENSQKK